MKAEETRRRLISELETQFSKADVNFTAFKTPDDPATNFPSPSFDKPKMFMPKTSGRLEMITTSEIPAVNGIGFKNSKSTNKIKLNENQEIYSMKELINMQPENMKTLSYDEKIVKTQLALVKKKEWQDILFEDIDWFKKVDVVSGIKNLFRKF